MKHGVVQDKLWLPGLLKMQMLVDVGLLRPHPVGARRIRLLGVRRRLAAGAASVVELPQGGRRRHHRRHAVPLALRARQPVRRREERLLPSARRTSRSAWDEHGRAYAATADDAAYATFELARAASIAQINSSWCTRVRRDDLVTFHVDGTLGSAVAGLTDCWTRRGSTRRKPVWNPDVPQTIDFFGTWQEMPDNEPYDNAFKVEWELFIRHSASDAPFRWDLLEGAKGVQLAELGLQSWARAALARRAGARRSEPMARHEPAAARGRNAASLTRCATRPPGPAAPPRALQPRRLRGGARRRRSARRRATHGSTPRSTGTRRSRTAAICGRSGLGVAEAMDTAQRGMGLDWPTSLELIRRSLAARATPPARVIACGAGTDHLEPAGAHGIDRRHRAPTRSSARPSRAAAAASS